MPEISHVVVVDENNAIGKDNKLLCHLPADLKHFKALTVGHPVIMGRKTFDSLGKPLPNRRNIIVTTQALDFAGCEVAHSIEEAINLCQAEEKLAIIGGATIYSQSLALVDKVHLTRIHHAFDADTYYPELKEEEWIELSKEGHEADEKNRYSYTFITLKKKQ